MKALKDEIAEFIEKPDRVRLRKILEGNFGEFDFFDFKAAWIEYSKLAKHIIANANSGGGIIIIGVKEKEKETEIIGLDSLKEKADVEKSLKKYIPKYLEFNILDFTYEDSEYQKLKGKSFQLITIPKDVKYLPYVSEKDGKNITKNTIYVRKNTESSPADYRDIQKILNERIESEYSTNSEITLEEHLAQLKTLYTNLEKYKTWNIQSNILDINPLLEKKRKVSKRRF